MPKGKDIVTAMVRERLAALRDAHGLTDSGMARAARQRQQDVSRFFNADMKYPPLDFLDALCRVFDRTLADVLASELPKPERPDWQARVLAAMKAMEPAERLAFEMLVAPKGVNGTARSRGARGGRKG